MKNHHLVTVAALCMTIMTGCDMREPEKLDPATKPQEAPQPVDLGDLGGLADGAKAIQGRISSTHAPVLPVALEVEQRFMLHPGEKEDASMDINVAGLSSLTIDPMIRSYSGSPDCAANPEAGVVDLQWSLDGGPSQSLRVDRTVRKQVPLDVAGKTTLRIASSSGNGVVWCDWLLVGFSDVKAAAP